MGLLSAGPGRLVSAASELRWPLAALLLALLLAGCASGPRGGGSRDGPPSDPPGRLEDTPDAVPRIEPLRSGGPNKPYEVLGRSYTPETRDLPLRERGLASWYGRKFHGRRTANGEVYDMYAMTAAHKTMPLPSYARVRNPANGREIVVRINDRGPFVVGRVIDLSYAAAVKLGVRGLAQVEVERITFEAIRTGAWRRDGPVASQASQDTAPGEAVAATGGEARTPPAVDRANAAVASAAAAETVATTPPPSAATGSGAIATANAEAVAGGGAVADAGTSAATPAPPPVSAAARGFWVQLGAFRERGGAEDFQQRISAELDWLKPLMAVFSEAPLFRLQAGPYASRDEAQGAAERVREALRLVPVIIERR